VNEYEGLNLPALLNLMHQLVMPERISWMPQTPGWWLLLVWLLALVLLSLRHWRKRRRATRYRREASKALGRIATTAAADPAGSAAQIALLLKRTALVAYPRDKVASLYGADWAAFLCESAHGDPQVAAGAAQLAAAAYRSDSDGRALVKPAGRWIEVHGA
jgi:hypothetical protein